jgi:hypothetical protein
MRSPEPRTWHSCNNGNCVEVARQGDTVFIRDGKNPEGPVLSFSGDEWSSFRDGVRSGDFDAV